MHDFNNDHLHGSYAYGVCRDESITSENEVDIEDFDEDFDEDFEDYSDDDLEVDHEIEVVRPRIYPTPK